MEDIIKTPFGELTIGFASGDACQLTTVDSLTINRCLYKGTAYLERLDAEAPWSVANLYFSRPDGDMPQMMRNRVEAEYRQVPTSWINGLTNSARDTLHDELPTLVMAFCEARPDIVESADRAYRQRQIDGHQQHITRLQQEIEAKQQELAEALLSLEELRNQFFERFERFGQRQGEAPLQAVTKLEP